MTVAIADIVQAVCEHYHVSALELLSHRRQSARARPRQVVMYLARELTTQSLPQIGRRLDRDHSTILHGIRAVERRLLHDRELAAEIAEIAARITNPDQPTLPLGKA